MSPSVLEALRMRLLLFQVSGLLIGGQMSRPRAHVVASLRRGAPSVDPPLRAIWNPGIVDASVEQAVLAEAAAGPAEALAPSTALQMAQTGADIASLPRSCKAEALTQIPKHLLVPVLTELLHDVLLRRRIVAQLHDAADPACDFLHTAAVDATFDDAMFDFPMLRLFPPSREALRGGWDATFGADAAHVPSDIDTALSCLTEAWSETEDYRRSRSAAELAFFRADIDAQDKISWSAFTDYIAEHLAVSSATGMSESDRSDFFFDVTHSRHIHGPSVGARGVVQVREGSGHTDFQHLLCFGRKDHSRVINMTLDTVVAPLDLSDVRCALALRTGGGASKLNGGRHARGGAVPDVLAVSGSDMSLRFYHPDDTPVPVASALGMEATKSGGGNALLVVRPFKTIACEATPTAMMPISEYAADVPPAVRILIGDGHGRLVVVDATTAMSPASDYAMSVMGQSHPHSKSITGIEFVKLQDMILTSSLDGYLCLSDANSLTVQRRLFAQSSGVTELRYSTVHNTAVTLGFGKVATMWSGLGRGRKFTLFDGVLPHMTLLIAVRLSESTGQIITVDAGGLMKVWSLVNSKCLYSRHLFAGSDVASIGTDDAEQAEHTATGGAGVPRARRGGPTRDVQAVVDAMVGFAAPDMTVAPAQTVGFSEPEGTLVAIGHHTHAVAKYMTSKQVAKAHMEPVVAVTAGSSALLTATAAEVKAWCLRTGTLLRAIPMQRSDNSDTSLVTCIAHDGAAGARVFVGRGGGSVCVFRLGTGRLLKMLSPSEDDRRQMSSTAAPGVTLAVTGVHLQEDSPRTLCAAHANGSVCLYQDEGIRRTPLRVLSLSHSGALQVAVAFSSAAKLGAAVDAMGQVQIVPTDSVTGTTAHDFVENDNVSVMCFCGTLPLLAVGGASGDISLRHVRAGLRHEPVVNSQEAPVVGKIEHWSAPTSLAFASSTWTLYAGDADGCVASYSIAGALHGFAAQGLRPCGLLRKFDTCDLSRVLKARPTLTDDPVAAAARAAPAGAKVPMPHLDAVLTAEMVNRTYVAEADAAAREKKAAHLGGRALLTGVCPDELHTTSGGSAAASARAQSLGGVTAVSVVEDLTSADGAERCLVAVGYTSGAVLLFDALLSAVVADVLANFPAPLPSRELGTSALVPSAVAELRFLRMLKHWRAAYDAGKTTAAAEGREGWAFPASSMRPPTFLTVRAVQMLSSEDDRPPLYFDWSPAEVSDGVARRGARFTRHSALHRSRIARKRNELRTAQERRNAEAAQAENETTARTRMEETLRVRRGSVVRRASGASASVGDETPGGDRGRSLSAFIEGISRPSSALSGFESTRRDSDSQRQASLNSDDEGSPAAMPAVINVVVPEASPDVATSKPRPSIAVQRKRRMKSVSIAAFSTLSLSARPVEAVPITGDGEGSASVQGSDTFHARSSVFQTEDRQGASGGGVLLGGARDPSLDRSRPDFIQATKRTKVVTVAAVADADSHTGEDGRGLSRQLSGTLGVSTRPSRAAAGFLMASFTDRPPSEASDDAFAEEKARRPRAVEHRPHVPMPRGAGSTTAARRLFAHPQLDSAKPVAPPAVEMPYRDVMPPTPPSEMQARPTSAVPAKTAVHKRLVEEWHRFGNTETYSARARAPSQQRDARLQQDMGAVTRTRPIWREV